jgi:hypothetical protein
MHQPPHRQQRLNTTPTSTTTTTTTTLAPLTFSKSAWCDGIGRPSVFCLRDEAAHRQRLRHVAHCYTPNVLRETEPLVRTEAAQLLAVMKLRPGAAMDVPYLFRMLAMDVIDGVCPKRVTSLSPLLIIFSCFSAFSHRLCCAVIDLSCGIRLYGFSWRLRLSSSIVRIRWLKMSDCYDTPDVPPQVFWGADERHAARLRSLPCHALPRF